MENSVTQTCRVKFSVKQWSILIGVLNSWVILIKFNQSLSPLFFIFVSVGLRMGFSITNFLIVILSFQDPVFFIFKPLRNVIMNSIKPDLLCALLLSWFLFDLLYRSLINKFGSASIFIDNNLDIWALPLRIRPNGLFGPFRRTPLHSIRQIVLLLEIPAQVILILNRLIYLRLRTVVRIPFFG